MPKLAYFIGHIVNIAMVFAFVGAEAGDDGRNQC
jgi:hypothetical protein